MSTLLDTFEPVPLSKYHGLQKMSLVKLVTLRNASFTLSLVISPSMPNKASVAMRPAR